LVAKSNSINPTGPSGERGGEVRQNKGGGGVNSNFTGRLGIRRGSKNFPSYEMGRRERKNAKTEKEKTVAIKRA